MDAAYLLIGIVIGVLIGVFVYILKARKKPPVLGTLCVDRSDPDGPYLFLKLHCDPDYILHQTYVTFVVENHPSRK